MCNLILATKKLPEKLREKPYITKKAEEERENLLEDDDTTTAEKEPSYNRSNIENSQG